MDKNNIIKLVSIDTLRCLNKPIDKKIHSVPALYLLDAKKLLFGKEVFDYLILENKFAFSGQNTRENKKMKDLPEPNILSQRMNIEPQAFALGAISSEQFSNIDESNNVLSDKNYKWDFITDNNVEIKDNKKYDESKDEKKLPTMEEIMKRRANEIL